MATGKADASAKDSVVLLYGDESFLRDRRCREILESFTPAENAEYNVGIYQGPDVDLDVVISGCNTLPVFSDWRLVVVRDIDLTLASAHDPFVEYLRRPNPSTRLLLTAGAVRSAKPRSKSKAKSKAKTKSKGNVRELLALIAQKEEFAALKTDSAIQFVKQASKVRAMQISGAAARELVELVGTDASRLDSEVEKAVLYAGGREKIELGDVEALTWRTRGHTMFELTDAVAIGDRGAVLRHLGALFEDGNDALALLGMIAWHMRRTIRAAALIEAGASPSQVARGVGVHWGVAEKFTDTCRRLGTRGATRAILRLRTADRLLKSTPEDKRRVVERTLLEMMAGRSRDL